MIVEILEALFLILTLLMTAYLIRHYVFTLTVLNRAHNRKKAAATTKNEAYQPPVSILIPAYNEERVIGRILQGMTKLTYPKDKMQVIVIDDASTDNTGKIAEGYAKPHNYIKIIHRNQREGGKGKASALNTGLKQADGEIIFCFDADYYPQRDIIEKLVAEFSDPKVGAVQGRVIVLNEPQNLVTRLVALERIGGYRVDQQARDSLGLITQFGGTVGGFRRGLLESLDGWDESILAEDTDLTFRVYLAGYKIRYVNDAECYEEAVENCARAIAVDIVAWATFLSAVTHQQLNSVVEINIKVTVNVAGNGNADFLRRISCVVFRVCFAWNRSRMSAYCVVTRKCEREKRVMVDVCGFSPIILQVML